MTRERLPVDRQGVTKRIHLTSAREDKIKDLKIYITTGEYADGRPGELFIKADKSGTTIAGLLDALSVTTSLALQSGVPLETLMDKWANMCFEPSGTTSDPKLPRVTSIVDAISQWLRIRYCGKEVRSCISTKEEGCDCSSLHV